MLKVSETQKYYYVLNFICPEIAAVLQKVNTETAAEVQEIRIRAGQPVMLTAGGRTVFIHKTGALSFINTIGLLTATANDIEETFKKLCEYSVHTRELEIKNGYLKISGGHRAGIGGTYVGGILQEISSINIRVARQYHGSSNEILNSIPSDFGGIIIAGAPNSGKTTLIRDIARKLSNGEYFKDEHRYRRVTVIDERGEIAALVKGQPQNDVGSCDVITGMEKEQGIEIAVRTLSPEYIVLDEIGKITEARAVSAALSCGVKFIATIHAGSLLELKANRSMGLMLESGAFSHVVMLGGGAGRIKMIITAGEMGVKSGVSA